MVDSAIEVPEQGAQEGLFAAGGPRDDRSLLVLTDGRNRSRHTMEDVLIHIGKLTYLYFGYLSY